MSRFWLEGDEWEIFLLDFAHLKRFAAGIEAVSFPSL